MLHRHDGEGVILISQPAHAWISGQLAAPWGRQELGIERVPEEVRLAAEQHDIAWLDWEAAPTLNPETGLPYAFNQLPTLDHLAIWSKSTSRAMSYGYFPAALISMHGTSLYERFHDFDSDSDTEERAAREFLRREHEFQQRALERISASHGLDEETVREYRSLVSAWDAASLALCMGASDPRTFSNLSADSGTIELTLTPIEGEPDSYRLSPWPYELERLTVGCEGRRISGTFDDVEVMREALREAETVQLEFRLSPG